MCIIEANCSKTVTTCISYLLILIHIDTIARMYKAILSIGALEFGVSITPIGRPTTAATTGQG